MFINLPKATRVGGGKAAIQPRAVMSEPASFRAPLHVLLDRGEKLCTKALHCPVPSHENEQKATKSNLKSKGFIQPSKGAERVFNIPQKPPNQQKPRIQTWLLKHVTYEQLHVVTTTTEGNSERPNWVFRSTHLEKQTGSRGVKQSGWGGDHRPDDPWWGIWQTLAGKRPFGDKMRRQDSPKSCLPDTWTFIEELHSDSPYLSDWQSERMRTSWAMPF